jgi:CheY-like chemotaxis protein/two-component sensor histidine kinase
MYPPRDAVQQQARDIIDRQVRHMARLIDDLLDVSRISRGKLTIRRETISLGAIPDQALEAVQPHLNDAGHQLTVALPPEPIVLEVDGVRIAQVLANLLQNSAKYTDRGGTVRLSAKTCGDAVEICVEDSGIGIAPEQLPHIFEMFWQGADAKQRAQGGLGIGLPLVRGLVELHGGSLSVRSDGPGCGSAFTVRLPLAGGVAAPEAGSHRPAHRNPAQLRVLVADDNRDAAASLAMMLEKLGHDVRVAYDGLQALELAEQLRPELALLDLGMPGADGCAVARRLRGAPWGRAALLVAVTGWGQPSDRARTEEAGFDRHAVKPLGFGELGELLALAAARRASGSGAQGRSAF